MEDPIIIMNPMMLKIVDEVDEVDNDPEPEQDLKEINVTQNMDPALYTCLSVVGAVFDDWTLKDYKAWKMEDFEPLSPIAESEDDLESKVNQEMREAWKNYDVGLVQPKTIPSMLSPVSDDGDDGDDGDDLDAILRSILSSPPSPPPPPTPASIVRSLPPSLDLCVFDVDEAAFDTLETPILTRAITV
jgi:hypothetical protein